MGQRSQTVLHTSTTPINTIVKNQKLSEKDRYRDEIELYVKLTKEQNEFEQLFGKNQPTTINVVHHHQWAYGRFLVLTAIRVLEFNKFATKSANPFDKEYTTFSQDIDSIEKWMDFTKNLLSIVNDQLGQHARVGVEGFYNLNYNDEPYVKDTITRFDCNDGVLILDLIHNKYCFVNVGGDSTVEQLPIMQPSSGKDYIEAYYPVKRTERFNEEYNKETTKVIDKKIKQNITVNKKFLRRLDKFQVLTMEELAKIYPEDFAEKVLQSSKKAKVIA